MITNRPFTENDLPMLKAAVDQNEFHPNQNPEDYFGDRKYTEVYEDEHGPIGVLRYTKSLRLCTVWCNNDDFSRNGKSVIAAIKDAVQRARESGFTEVIFETNSEKLKQFCTKSLGFEEAKDSTMILYV